MGFPRFRPGHRARVPPVLDADPAATRGRVATAGRLRARPGQSGVPGARTGLAAGLQRDHGPDRDQPAVGADRLPGPYRSARGRSGARAHPAAVLRADDAGLRCRRCRFRRRWWRRGGGATHLHTGIAGAASILEAAGAQRIFSGHQAGISFEPGVRGSLAEFDAACKTAGYGPGRCSLGALHIMGSARMGGSAASSATDPDGTTWDVDNIVVADGSTFPTAPGVNPMVTIEAIGYMNATRLAARLR
ncbi:GMC family oxidoreductase [Nocardia rhizosphaerae]|uniref:GMC family oxidoreductase n=1 Tax=Nocardia rhizosphaerae TaxID=1691571 RepID=A0ABV8L8P1_9NOCA